ncbi:hypothetical protein SDC9_101037 [bioreactor metagenome]|uniref:VanZ-like domain-containing protein n=1 Tax=bioreactor metagenome TaxID=1076179 RepID=A0A645APL8_9ZZZZ|nr:VanZ family protein [Erysipelotrichaceae bacterium]
MKNRNLVIHWLTVIVWMLIIFYLSSQPAVKSDGLSIGLISRLFYIVGIDASELSSLDLWNLIIRKGAHFSAYLVLGLLMLNALRLTLGFSFHSVIIAIAVCTIYAASDEVHQYFVTGRSCQLTDVLIDCSGAIIGICFLFLLNYILHRDIKT